MEVRHVRVGEQERLSELHPELVLQQPKLAAPFLFPTGYQDCDFPYVFYAIEEGQIASYIKSWPDTLYYEDLAYSWAWNGMLFTEPAYRRRGLAFAMIERQLEEFRRRGIIWGGVFSSAEALQLYESMGFCMPGHVPRLCMTRGAAFIQCESNHVEEISPVAFADLISGGPVFDEQKFHWGSDANWFESRREKPNIDKIYAVWPQGETEPSSFLFVRSRVLGRNPLNRKFDGLEMMSVVEYGQFQLRNNFPEVLVGAALQLFAASDAALIEIVTSSQLIKEAARRSGLAPVGKGMSFKFKAPEQSPLCGRQIQLSEWHLSHYCGDAFSFA